MRTSRIKPGFVNTLFGFPRINAELLIIAALPWATEIRFLNPGIETCLANCRRRLWEPEKYASKADQDARLEFLLQWVRDYAVRTDECSLARHRALYDGYSGSKLEIH